MPMISTTTGWFPVGDTTASAVCVTHATPTTAVVVCEPFGMEALAGDRALNALTLRLATAGAWVLRVRPPGAADSSDLDPSESVVAPWRDTVGAAIDLAKRSTGLATVSVVGLRLGASLAADACSQRSDVDRLVLWAPVSGRSFLRELRLVGAAGVHPERATPASPTAGAVRAVEGAGFAVWAASADDLGAVDVARLGRRPAPEVLVIERDDVPSAKAVIAHLTGLGSRVNVQTTPGFAAMRLDDPESGDIPNATIDPLIAWLVPDASEDHGRACCLLSPSAEFGPVVERVVVVNCDDGVALHGVLTEAGPRTNSPQNGRPGYPDVVILSTGTNPAGGPGRMHTQLARRWAAAGCRVLRVDRRGVGSTALLHGCELPPERVLEAVARVDVYHDRQASDVVAIEQFLRRDLGSSAYVVIGTCSGAFAAFHAPRLGARPVAIVCMNQVVFDNTEWRLDDDSPAFAVKARYELAKVLRDPRRWPAIVRGEVPIRPAVRRLAQYVRLRFGGASARRGDAAGLGAQLTATAAAGVAQVQVFDEAETGFGYLRFQADDVVEQLVGTGRFVLTTAAGVGHTFGSERAREWVAGTIERDLRQVGVVFPTWAASCETAVPIAS